MSDTKTNIYTRINHWFNAGGILFLLLLLAVFMNEHINAFRNIGLYGVVIMAMLYLVTTKLEIRVPSGFAILLIIFSLLVLQGVLRSEDGVVEGLDHFRRTYFKGFVLAMGIPLFVTNYKTVSMVIVSLFVSAIGVLSSELYRYFADDNARFFYAGNAVRHSAHLIDFIDPIAVACTRYRSPLVRYSAVVVIVGFTILVIGTGARGGWLALVAGFLATYFLVNKDNNVISTIAKSLTRVMVIVVGAYLLAPDNSIVKNKFDEFKHGLSEPVRMEIIFPTYYSTIINSPMLGYGYSKQLEYRIENIADLEEEVFNNAVHHGPHNQFLLYGIYFGIVGVIVYIIVIVWTLLRLIRRSIYEEDLGMRLLSAAGAGMVLAEYITRSMTDIVPGYWLGVPVGIALINIRKEKI